MKALGLMSFILMASCSTIQKEEERAQEVQEVFAEMHSSSLSKFKGQIHLKDLKDEIRVTVDLVGLMPSRKLGLHVHEFGFCEGPNYESAGRHFNPYHANHGSPEHQFHHLGDMGNIETNEEGVAKKVILISKKNQNDLSLFIGKSIIIHQEEDDLRSQPSGDSGKRISCGLILPL